jgi:hypothetical protein
MIRRTTLKRQITDDFSQFQTSKSISSRIYLQKSSNFYEVFSRTFVRDKDTFHYPRSFKKGVFSINFVEKLAQNRPRPIKSEFIFLYNFVKNELQSAESR